MSPSLFRSALAGVALLSSVAAQAQVGDFFRNVLPPGVEQGGVAGAVMLHAPRYAGSDQERLRVLPSVDYQWREGWFAGVVNGLGYRVSGGSGQVYGLRLSMDFGREEDDSSALRGMGDLKPRLLAGAFYNQELGGGFNLSSSLRTGRGTLLDLGVSWGHALRPDLRVAAGVAMSWADARHTQSYFGVNAAQSQASGYPVFKPGAGLRDVRASASVIYRPLRDWSLTATLGQGSLRGDVQRSPLVRDASPQSLILTVGHHF
ncbi:MipA/OmpV family protein [Kinneretia asaccharophila]|uniref:Outer membrane scaffolding protein for murein synthesis (MipA/OmpV family) n=1 Tax=Roseateles asaccharophilus TaxID=582607 RepID=A0A4R6MVV2_9BURK|nr:MipA/OmpV family protein [Roseateles asaccharophilus]MDN3545947.1 MipA/OmpV family protein [Roseateles asaccharophilus]TDP06602.1 outer membrane scaffolding protein for murein synthesis (MipA/OmpV family) [Roseateles asaccharophilus]